MSRSIFRVFVAGFAAALLSSCGSSTSTFVVKGAASSSRSELSRTPTGSPTVFNLKVYAAYLTTNADCSGPFVEVANNGTSGTSYDMVAAPTIISASPAAATYNCFILRMSDVMTFRPDATAAAAFPGVCSTSTDATFDIFRSGETWKDKDLNDVTGTGDQSTPTEASTTVSGATVPGVTIFASTDTAAAVARGISSNQVLSLTSAVTVTATTSTLTLVTDFQNKVNDSSSHCWMEAGTMTIR